MVALTTTAVIHDLVASDRVAKRHQFLSDFCDRDVPFDLLEGFVVEAFQRFGEPVSEAFVFLAEVRRPVAVPQARDELEVSLALRSASARRTVSSTGEREPSQLLSTCLTPAA